MAIIELTDQNFAEKVIESELPVVVDFWAEWCAPCRRLGPIVEELAQDHEDKLRVAKLNIDAHPATAQAYSVMSIPTIIYFAKGKEVKRVVGAREKAELEAEFGLA